MICTACDQEINSEDVRLDGDNPYCEECFSDRFNTCSRCDATIPIDETHYNDAGDSYCSECWDSEYDDDAPDNPEVTDVDRDLIIQVARSWLNGKTETRRTISINEKDKYLKIIKSRVGLVHLPIYLYGLRDREEYEISISQNLLEDVQEYLRLHNLKFKVIDNQGCNRLGVSLNLRKHNLNDIINLIKAITSIKEPAEILS